MAEDDLEPEAIAEAGLVAAAESAIGLAILVVLFRNRNTINIDDLNRLNG